MADLVDLAEVLKKVQEKTYNSYSEASEAVAEVILPLMGLKLEVYSDRKSCGCCSTIYYKFEAVETENVEPEHEEEA